MTSFLRLNGIVVPVAQDQASLAPEAIGKMRRTAGGSINASRRLRKGGWKFTTALQLAADALAFRELICGEGHVLSFDSSFYTSQGMAPVSIGSDWALTASAPKFGAKCAIVTTTNHLVYQFFSASSAWTLAWWWNEGAFAHYVLNSAGAAWVNGVGGFTAGDTAGLDNVTAGAAAFAATGGTARLDDVVALPFLAPATWPPQMYAWGATAGQPFSQLPFLVADGLFVEQNTRIGVLGGDAPPGRLFLSQAVKNLHDFSFDLAEV